MILQQQKQQQQNNKIVNSRNQTFKSFVWFDRELLQSICVWMAGYSEWDSITILQIAGVLVYNFLL